MSNEVINQQPTVERAKELELQAKEGLEQLKTGHDRAIIACHKMRDTKAYKVLGFKSYYAWGDSALDLKKTRLNELALAGEVHQELLNGMAETVQAVKVSTVSESHNTVVNIKVENDSSDEEKTEIDFEGVIDNTDKETVNPVFTESDLSEISTPQLIALAKAPKGERVSVLDKVVVEAKAEDKEITTKTIKEAIKASAPPVEYIEPSDEEKAEAIKKQHRSAMAKVSKVSESLTDLDVSNVASEEIDSWKIYLNDVKDSILTLEKQLGFE